MYRDTAWLKPNWCFLGAEPVTTFVSVNINITVTLLILHLNIKIAGLLYFPFAKATIHCML